MKVKTVWTADLPKEEKDAFTKDVYTWAHTAVGKKFLQLMQRQLETLDAGETKLESYDCPTWAYRQAHLNGYRQHILQVLSLLETE